MTTDEPPEFGTGINDSQVTWSPDGIWIAFVSEGRGLEEDSCDLWTMDPRDRDGDGFGDDLQRLTFDEGFNCDAFEDVTQQWSPNPSMIAFTSVRSGYFDIWLVNADDPTDLRNGPTPPPATRTSRAGRWTERRSSSAALGRAPTSSTRSPSHLRTGRVGGVPAPTQLTFDGENKTEADWGRMARVAGTATLTVSTSDHGRVRSRPVGIARGRHCTATFVRSVTVTMTATPASGHVFRRWGGACSGTGPTCTVQMGHAKSAVARFART